LSVLFLTGKQLHTSILNLMFRMASISNQGKIDTEQIENLPLNRRFDCNSIALFAPLLTFGKNRSHTCFILPHRIFWPIAANPGKKEY